MAFKILIMGLPGAGKTTLANEIYECFKSLGITVDWYNADKIREQYNDWDFSQEGRIRQSQRMRELADTSTANYVICDFVAPLPEQRNQFSADYVIWIHTENESRYPETDAIFVPPSKYNYYVNTKDAPKWCSEIVKHLLLLKKHEIKI